MLIALIILSVASCKTNSQTVVVSGPMYYGVESSAYIYIYGDKECIGFMISNLWAGRVDISSGKCPFTIKPIKLKSPKVISYLSNDQLNDDIEIFTLKKDGMFEGNQLLQDSNLPSDIRNITSNTPFFTKPISDSEYKLLITTIDNIYYHFEDQYIVNGCFLKTFYLRCFLHLYKGVVLPDFYLNDGIKSINGLPTGLYSQDNFRGINYALFYDPNPEVWSFLVDFVSSIISNPNSKQEEIKGSFSALKHMYFIGDQNRRKYIKSRFSGDTSLKTFINLVDSIGN